MTRNLLLFLQLIATVASFNVYGASNQEECFDIENDQEESDQKDYFDSMRGVFVTTYKPLEKDLKKIKAFNDSMYKTLSVNITDNMPSENTVSDYSINIENSATGMCVISSMIKTIVMINPEDAERIQVRFMKPSIKRDVHSIYIGKGYASQEKYDDANRILNVLANKYNATSALLLMANIAIKQADITNPLVNLQKAQGFIDRLREQDYNLKPIHENELKATESRIQEAQKKMKHFIKQWQTR